MAFIDVSTLLQPVHRDMPCGPDLEYSPRYLEAALALEGTPDAQYGTLHIAAVEPDWKAVKAATLELFAQSRDLRLAVWLARSLVALHGAAAIADGLALVAGLLTHHWDRVHPQLDAEDDRDPTERLSVLLALDDKAGFVRECRMAPLLDSPLHGPICLHDVESADAEPDANAAARALSPTAIDAAFADARFEDIAAMADALWSASASLERIDARLTERVGHRRTIALGSLERVLTRANEVVRAQLDRHRAPACGHELPDFAQLDAVVAQAPSEAITGRSDVVRVLDAVCAYYARAEPSSPVPVLLRRARHLVGMNFIDVVSDLTPAGHEQARHWAGNEPE